MPKQIVQWLGESKNNDQTTLLAPKSDLTSAEQTTSETFRKWLECKVIVWKCVACVKFRPNIGWTSNLQNFLKSTWVATQKIVFKGSGSWRGVDTNRHFLTRHTQINVLDALQTWIDKNLTCGRHKLTKIWRGKHGLTKIWQEVDTNQQKFDAWQTRICSEWSERVVQICTIGPNWCVWRCHHVWLRDCVWCCKSVEGQKKLAWTGLDKVKKGFFKQVFLRISLFTTGHKKSGLTRGEVDATPFEAAFSLTFSLVKK